MTKIIKSNFTWEVILLITLMENSTLNDKILPTFFRVGFAAESIARWVTERTDIHVSKIPLLIHSSVSIQIDAIEGLFLEGYAVSRKPPEKNKRNRTSEPPTENRLKSFTCAEKNWPFFALQLISMAEIKPNLGCRVNFGGFLQAGILLRVS